jgi:hypothetical protein
MQDTVFFEKKEKKLPKGLTKPRETTIINPLLFWVNLFDTIKKEFLDETGHSYQH